MSLPIAAVGPLNVETNPILMESAAKAEFASARAAAPASQNAVLISVPSSLFLCREASRPLSPCSRVFFASRLGVAANPNRRLRLELSAQRKCLCTIIRTGDEWQEL